MVTIVLMNYLFFRSFNLRNTVLRPAALNLPRLNFSSLNGGTVNNKFKNRTFLHALPPSVAFNVGVRNYGMIVAR